MESRRPRLLCYGHDDMLLYTRRCILQREYSVEICCSLASLGVFLRQGPWHLVLLCHSVADSECDSVIELSRAAWPEVKVLTLHEAFMGECLLHSDRTMENLEGPPALLREIHALLAIAASAGKCPSPL